jgi:hypothetical protein
MAFKKGESGNANGRRPGIPNKITTSAKAAFLYAFDAAGGPERLAKFAKSNYTEFIKIFSRLIPQDANISMVTERPIERMTVEEIEAAIKEIIGEPYTMNDIRKG